MPEQPVPAHWTEEVDAKQHPVPDAPPFPPEMPPPYRRPVPQVQQASQSPASRNTVNWEWTPRVIFWIAAMMVIPVCIFSVSAAIDEDWFDSVRLSAFDEDILDQCSDDNISTATNDFCNLYHSFMILQLISALLALVALALLSMALFAPASGWCCSVKALGFGGGYAVAALALFQFVAIVLIFRITQSDTAQRSDDTDGYNGLGSTFWVAVVGFVLALFDAIFLLNFASSAGDGLFYECIGKTMTLKS